MQSKDRTGNLENRNKNEIVSRNIWKDPANRRKKGERNFLKISKIKKVNFLVSISNNNFHDCHNYFNQDTEKYLKEASLNIFYFLLFLTGRKSSQILQLKFNPLRGNPTKWSKKLKQFVGFCRRIV